MKAHLPDGYRDGALILSLIHRIYSLPVEGFKRLHRGTVVCVTVRGQLHALFDTGFARVVMVERRRFSGCRQGIEVLFINHGNAVLTVTHVAWKWQRGLVQRYFMGSGLTTYCCKVECPARKAISALSMNVTIDHEYANDPLAIDASPFSAPCYLLPAGSSSLPVKSDKFTYLVVCLSFRLWEWMPLYLYLAAIETVLRWVISLALLERRFISR
ncbi:hypothetical protein [Pseudomonas chlororaphis]|uniref:hypothetical protein n=2 Tax=Pseudomonas chlororaphis TaxID=587753 RepID=UPI001475B53B|nr:hypothetical protein [Pseudomonas chlororaphis]NNB41797.1 hypothetical protein [Pseudomonas chlororaphis]